MQVCLVERVSKVNGLPDSPCCRQLSRQPLNRYCSLIETEASVSIDVVSVYFINIMCICICYIYYIVFISLTLCIYVCYFSVCMQDLRGYELLRKLLMKGELSLDIVVSIARNLAVVHRGTHISTIGPSAIDNLNKEFE